MSESGDRLKLAMAYRKIDQPMLADGVGCTQGAISQILTGSTQRSRFLPDIAAFLRVSLDWLRGDGARDDENAMTQGVDATQFNLRAATEQLDLVGIAQIDAQYGMGETFIDQHVEQEIQYFPRNWVQAITDSPPEKLVWAKGWGDSMVPTIHPTDLILIDLSQTRVREQDVIWAAAVGDMGMIKRLRVRADGVTILSDNPNVSDDYATHDEIHIVGRVIFIGRRL